MKNIQNNTSLKNPNGANFSAILHEECTEIASFRGDEIKINTLGDEIFHRAIGAIDGAFKKNEDQQSVTVEGMIKELIPKGALSAARIRLKRFISGMFESLSAPPNEYYDKIFDNPPILQFFVKEAILASQTSKAHIVQVFCGAPDNPQSIRNLYDLSKGFQNNLAIIQGLSFMEMIFRESKSLAPSTCDDLRKEIQTYLRKITSKQGEEIKDPMDFAATLLARIKNKNAETYKAFSIPNLQVKIMENGSKSQYELLKHHIDHYAATVTTSCCQKKSEKKVLNDLKKEVIGELKKTANQKNNKDELRKIIDSRKKQLLPFLKEKGECNRGISKKFTHFKDEIIDLHKKHEMSDNKLDELFQKFFHSKG